MHSYLNRLPPTACILLHCQPYSEMVIRRISPFILGLFIMQSAMAQVGQTGLSFLKLGVGARALGMGEAYSAVASDPTATYYNPASLSLSHNSQILFMHKEYVQDTRTEFLAATTSLARRSTLRC